MTTSQIRYRMSVAGSFAGLNAWAAGVLIPFFVTLPEDRQWVAGALDSGLVGLLIGCFAIVSFDGLYARERGAAKRLARAVGGALGGGVAGGAGALLAWWVLAGWMSEWPRAGIVFAWCLTGAFVGLVIGVIRYGLMLPHLLLSLFGGLFGATLGGVALVGLGGHVPHLRVVGQMLTGLSICLFSTLAVDIARRAVLRYLSSDDAEIGKALAVKQWDLLPRTRMLFGSAPRGPLGVPYVRIADRRVAKYHAWLTWNEGGFQVYAHEPENITPSRAPYRTLEAGQPPVTVMGRHNLSHGDLIKMGRTLFVFTLRGRPVEAAAAAKTKRSVAPMRSVAGMLAAALLLPLGAALAQDRSGGALVPAERLQLLRVQEGSEAPAFRLTLNIVDAQGAPREVSILDPREVVNRARVFEGDTQLKVSHVALNSLPRRYAILLVDVSGSMLEPAGDGRTKFQVMKQACLRFADDFADGVDEVAVIPFHSHDVVKGVKEAKFFTTKKELLDYVNALSMPGQPRHRAAPKTPRVQYNTGLFSAVRAALGKLREIKDAHGTDAQCLLVAMTDGQNHVLKGDDPGLETDPRPVAAFAAEVAINLITIGFGDKGNLNEDDLKRLAWPSAANYFHARASADLMAAFKRARSLQVERLRLTFLPRQGLISQLVNPHEYRVQLQLPDGPPLETSVTWVPKPVNVPEGVLSPEERGDVKQHRFSLLLPLLIYLLFFALHHHLWVRMPARLWADEEDARVLRRRAMELLNGGRG